MEDVFALVAITLLQLCHGDTAQPEWFAANLVNEPGFTPKPITEIFTSDSPFTSKNPALFTQPTTGGTSTLPSNSQPTVDTKVLQNENTPLQNRGPTVPQIPEIMSQVVENQPKNELPNFLIVFDPREGVDPNQPSSAPTSPQTEAPVSKNQASSASFPSTSQFTTPIPSTQRTLPILQPGSPEQILQNVSPTAFQTGSLRPVVNNVSPTTWQLSPVVVYPLQFPGVIPSANTTELPITTSGRPILPPVAQPARPTNSKPVLTVRVKAPQGSTTNIHINPKTTVRPTTTRRRKSPRRPYNYETCINSCNGKKEPICSSLLGQNPINPDKLKGFPSICHMACHNSFKKEQVYEKLTDGRCGKLRTRIRPVDKKKLNREELNKAQYTIVHNVPDTVVEFSPLRH